jgi:3-hydroxyacyl-[acyl-carrier-protein] dehydratase
MAHSDLIKNGTVDIEGIMQLLPHRYPFLLVDRLEQINGDDSCVGIKNVTANEPCFMGHFPGKPIFPGVLLIEGMAQTAGALCILAKTADAAQLVYFMTIDKARFRKPVVPGDRVEFHVKKIRARAAIWKFYAEAIVDGVKVAEAEVCAMLADAVSA